MKMEVNVCYLHLVEEGKWQWFLADKHGKTLLKCPDKYFSLKWAVEGYETKGKEYRDRLK